MRKILGILLVVLLIFTYSMPAYAETNTDNIPPEEINQPAEEGGGEEPPPAEEGGGEEPPLAKDEGGEEPPAEKEETLLQPPLVPLPVFEGEIPTALEAEFEDYNQYVQSGVRTLTFGQWFSKPWIENLRIIGVPQAGKTLSVAYDFHSELNWSNLDNSLIYWTVNNRIRSWDSETLDLYEEDMNKVVKVHVLPRNALYVWGDWTCSEPVTVEMAHLWMTVDDGYELYVNGEHLYTDPINPNSDDESWRDLDWYYLDNPRAPEDMTFAVKGYDRTGGTSTVSGFVLSYYYPGSNSRKDGNHWYSTSDDWYIYIEEDPPEHYQGITWKDPEYKSIMGGEEDHGWFMANEIEKYPTWPRPKDRNASYIWSEDYIEEDRGEFDSPVYFRNHLVLLSPPEAVINSIIGEGKLGTTLEADYDVTDPDGDDVSGSLLEWYVDGTLVGTGPTFEIDDPEYINQGIIFKVTPISDHEPSPGEPVASEEIIVMEPDVWVVAYDNYQLYINGLLVGEDLSGTPQDADDVDYYYFDDLRAKDPFSVDEDSVIAVKAWPDTGIVPREAIPEELEGMKVAVKMDEGDWIISDENWKTYYPGMPPTYDNLDPDMHWYHKDYKGQGWLPADVMMSKLYLTHEHLDDTGAKWLWAGIMEEPDLQIAPMPSPVYFRNMIELYEEEASVLSITEDDLLLGETTEARVQLKNESGGDFTPNDPTLYEVKIYLDGDYQGDATFNHAMGFYELIITPPFSEYQQEVSATVNSVDVSNTEMLTVSKEALVISSNLTLSDDIIPAGDEITAMVTLKNQYDEWVSGQSVHVIDGVDTPREAVEVSPGHYEVTYIPLGIGMHTVTYTVNGELADEEDSFEVKRKLFSLEHNQSTNGTTELEGSYESLVALAQMRDYSIDPPAHLKVDIIEEMERMAMGYSLKSDDFYSWPEVSWIMEARQPSMDEEPPLPINYLASNEGFLYNTIGDMIGELGHTRLSVPIASLDVARMSSMMATVSYDPSIENPIVLAQTATDDWTYKQVRVVDIDPSEHTFTLMLESWSSMGSYDTNGDMMEELVSYIVIETGVHEVSNGYIEAIQKSDPASLLPKTHEFSQHYDDPDVLSQVQTYNDTSPVWMRQNHIMSGSVELFKQGPDHNLGQLLDPPENEEMPLREVAQDEYPSPHGEEMIGILVLADELLMHEVSFTNTYDSVVPSQMIQHDNPATEPADPTRSGYNFTGWTLEGADYVFGTPVLEDIELTANWSSSGGGGGGETTTATINAVSDSLTTTANLSVDVDNSALLANDEDYEDFDRVYGAVNGSVDLSGSTVTFTPASDFVGRAYFYYEISDGGDSDSAIVVVTVEEAVVIEEEITPLGNGNPDAFVIINPEVTPLGVIEYGLPYITGYPDKSFKPDRQITRGEMAVIMARILKIANNFNEEPIYDDVDIDDWYFDEIQVISDLGIMSAYEDNMFMPNRPITHAEIAAVFTAYWDIRGIEMSAEGNNYTDISGHALEEEINKFYNSGISAGFIDRKFKPDSFTTRVQMIVMVNRALNRPELFDTVPSFNDVDENYWGFGAVEASTHRYEPEVSDMRKE